MDGVKLSVSFVMVKENLEFAIIIGIITLAKIALHAKEDVSLALSVRERTGQGCQQLDVILAIMTEISCVRFVRDPE